MTDDPASTAHAEEFATSWGVVVRGERWGTGPDRVVLIHEPGADLDAWLGLPRAISRTLPVAAMVYDLPGHGLSDDPWDPDRLPDLLRALTGHGANDGRTFLIAAGDTAGAALAQASDLPLAGVVGLSASGLTMPLARSARVPKLLLAGAQVYGDVDRARALAGQSGGWAMVTSVPASAHGTGLLDTDWNLRIVDAIVGFLRDCLHPRLSRPAETGHRPARAG